MKNILWIFLFILFMIPALTEAGIIGPASIRFADGDVMFKTPDNDEWLPASINTPLDEGDAIWCPDGSRAEIQLPDGTMVRMDGGSQLDLLANEDNFMHLHLASGRLYLKTSQTSANDSLQIDADDTTVVPAARTRLRIDMLPNSQEDVTIFKGTAYVEGNGSRTKVRAGEHIALEEGHSELLPLNPPDSWEYWNVDRDRAQSRSFKSDSYLPDELRGHSADFDTNGSWLRDPEYGMIWRPTVLVSNDWAPYRSGRWIWKDGDYVWISYESWGWVPYHYGRWTVVRGYGWCWVPPTRGDVYWGPGYVGWYATGNRVGWTPLAPGEIFYGHRHYGQNSVNVTNVNVNTTTVFYRNRQNPGGMTVVQQNDFLKGRTIIQQQSRNAPLSVSVSVGSPRIKPLRETRMPVIKQTTSKIVPPTTIVPRDNQELRNRFPRIIPEPGLQQRRQQSTPVAITPVTPSGKIPPAVDKRAVNPSATPTVIKTGSGARPQDVPAKQDEHQQPPKTSQPVPQQVPVTSGSTPQRTEQPKQKIIPVITPAAKPLQEQPKHEENRPHPMTPPATQQPVPAVSGTGSVPQHTEQSKRVNTPLMTPITPITQPQREAPKRDESRQRTVAPPTQQSAPTMSKEAPQRADQQKKAGTPLVAPREQATGEQQKRVWKVVTPENSGDKDNREKERKDKERK